MNFQLGDLVIGTDRDQIKTGIIRRIDRYYMIASVITRAVAMDACVFNYIFRKDMVLPLETVVPKYDILADKIGLNRYDLFEDAIAYFGPENNDIITGQPFGHGRMYYVEAGDEEGPKIDIMYSLAIFPLRLVLPLALEHFL